jgi:dihydroorotate dehydrogenase (fumarate)
VHNEALMDLSTTYLGLKLANPLIPSCPPPGCTRGGDDGERVRELVGLGAPALLMEPIFEEQISHERTDRLWYEQVYGSGSDASGQAAGRSPKDVRGDYLNRIAAIKRILPGPLVAAINCTTLGTWVDFAGSVESAGADALELNVYVLPTNPEERALEVERRLVDIVSAVRARVKIPLAVKLSPFYTSLPHLAKKLEAAGATGLVLFNRFFEPEFEEGMRPRNGGGIDSIELRLRLSWLSILSPQTKLSLAMSGAVQTGRDVLKGIMAGADAVQISLSALSAGPEYLETVLEGLTYHMEQAGQESISALRGCMNRPPANAQANGRLKPAAVETVVVNLD